MGKDPWYIESGRVRDLTGANVRDIRAETCSDEEGATNWKLPLVTYKRIKYGPTLERHRDW